MSLKKLGRYDLVRVLGKGAMGIVYEGRDPNLDRRVAIKTVKVENLSEEAAAEYEHRFRTEARSAARLQHPNIVSVYDSDRDGDIAFLVMEYIQGDDMKHHLDKGVRYSLEQSLKMVRDLLSALDYAHKQGIVHRDIKPANLLIEPGGRVKLTDFGVARIQDSGEATRTQGSMVGTLKYMSPEQVQGQKIDSRADLFSVGVVLYQLLTDKRPFDGDNDFSIIHQIIGHTPAPPSSFNARLPSAIDAVVSRALAKDREQRFATARDFASALQSAIRRAEDATVVPPANPFKQADSAGTGSRGHQMGTGAGTGAAAGSGSTVTQELELVYWKDIKDSTEPDELQGFLAKFPDGIYADLARKRLRKLSTNGSSPDQTILSGTRTQPDQDMEATRLLHSGTTPSFVAQPPAAAAPVVDASQPGFAAPPHDPTVPPAGVPAATISPATVPPATSPPVTEDADFARTVVQPRGPEEAAAEQGPQVPGAPSAAAAAPVSKKPPLAVFAAIGGVAAAGLVALMMMTGSKGAKEVESPLGAASAPASASMAATTAASASSRAAIVPASGTHAVAAANSPARPASATRRAASAARAKVAPASNVEPPRPAAPAPAPQREEPRPAPAPAAAASASPVDQCRDKVFLSKEFCLAEQCAKPGTRNHPLCVQRREEIRLREESKVRQGPQ
ncbi:MAG: serine/threonine-protein kinase [Burkholderiales bacterium]|nr:serine/threonine-protein kinase [Burkholderiales bacterium]